MAKLVCQSGPNAGHEYPLTKDLTVMGRQSSCEVQVLDNMASRAHCQIRRDGKLYSLVDLGSRNGTKLNGHKVGERLLSFGDRIAIGEAAYLLVKEPGDQDLNDLLTKYEVIEKVGEGGMGVVYKAKQRSMDRIVALKILSPKYSQRPKFVEQFIREARSAGQLNHPNIIQVHEVGSENDIQYFSMEFIDGPTCTQVLKGQNALAPFEALEIARQTARALEYAHQHRLIHQDIKPDNLMIGANNTVKLADLGISKTFDEAEADSGAKRVMGTPHYMAPEAAMGKKIDHRIDLYSLGATLYHLLAGRTPFNAASSTAVLRAQVMDVPPPLKEFKPDLADSLCTLVDKLMAKKPDDRFQTAAEVASEIERLQAEINEAEHRTPGDSSVILTRLSNVQRVGVIPSSSGETTGHSTDDAGALAKRLEQRKIRLIASIAGGIILLLIVLLMLARSRVASNGAENSVTNETPTTLAQQTPVTVAHTIDPRIIQRQEWMKQLNDIENALTVTEPAPDVDALKSRLAIIKDADSDGVLTARVVGLLDRIDAIIQRQRAESAGQKFAAFKIEVLKLQDEKNFDGAIQRLDGFDAKDEPSIRNRWTELRADVVRNRDLMVTSIRKRVELAAKFKNAAQLKSIRDSLPASFQTSDLAKEIDQAMTVLQGEQVVVHKQIARTIAAAVKAWNFKAAEEIYAANKATFADSPVKPQVDSYLATGRKLSEYVLVMEGKLKNVRRRFEGTINVFTNPDMTGADPQGLSLLITGGTMVLPWAKLTDDELKAVTLQVLVKDAANYDPIFAELAAVRAAADEPAK